MTILSIDTVSVVGYKYTYRKLKDHAKLNFSRKTLWRILHRNGITNWRAKERPFLTNEVAAKKTYVYKEVRPSYKGGMG